MANAFSDAHLGAIDRFLDGLHAVVFWLDVTEDNRFVFRKFSKHYPDYTGLDVTPLIGKTPQEALPSRQAETVAINYEKCRASGQPHIYEELLELGRGAVWWKTTLTPYKDRTGRVASIVGVADDITRWKTSEFKRRENAAALTALNQDLRMFTSMAVQDMRGPFMTIMGILNFLSDGFVDLGDGKADMLKYCEATAARGMEQMDRILERAQSINDVEEELTDVDFGHICGDITALVDPGKRFDISYPSLQVETDRAALQLGIRVLVENAMIHANSKIEIEASDYGDGRVFVTVFDDGIADPSGKRSDGTAMLPAGRNAASYSSMDMLRGLVASRDGVLEARRTEVRSGVELSFSLPGHIKRPSAEVLSA